MYYVELLRVRGTLIGWTVAYAIAIAATVLAVVFSKHHADLKASDTIPFEALLVLAGLLAGVVASTLAANMARENDGHLPLTWTKPASRLRLAAIMAGTDALGVAGAYALSLIAIFSILAIIGLAGHFTFDSSMGLTTVRTFAFPFAVYGFVWALTASLRRQAGAVIGFFWVAMMIVVALDAMGISGVFGTIVSLIDRINPMAYFQFHGEGKNLVIDVREAWVAVFALFAIGATGVVAGLAQWRRMEA